MQEPYWLLASDSWLLYAEFGLNYTLQLPLQSL